MKNEIELSPYKQEYDKLLMKFELPDDQKRYTGLPIEVLEEAEKNKSKHPTVILKDNLPVGFFVLEIDSEIAQLIGNPNALLLRSLSIDFKYQGNGFAKKAMDVLPSFIHSLLPEIDEIVLAVNEKNLAAIKLYVKAGFIDLGYRNEGTQGTQLIMHKKMIPTNTSLNKWNEQFSRVSKVGVQYTEQDIWLERYLPILNDRGFKEVLEIGCGSGNDTSYLDRNGFKVTASDFSETALSIVKENLPGVEILQHDTRNEFPFVNEQFDFVVGSLSLHYFDENTFNQIIREINRLLPPKGLLLIRLNSVHDSDASKEHDIERYFYSVDSCREHFESWKEVELAERIVNYYGKEKVIIEGIFEKHT